MQQPALQTPTRLPGLDLLRALAIFLVLMSHGPQPAQGELPTFISTLIHALQRGGWIGVDLFFVLSGFLVAGLLMREQQRHGRIQPVRFLVRSGWKLYPPLALFLAFVFVQNDLHRGYWPTDRLLANLLWIQNYTPGLQVHTWSLAVEEHAYFLLAAVFGTASLIALRRKRALKLNWIPWAFIPLAIGGLALRLSAAQSGDFHHYTHQYPTHLRIDSLLAGVVLAYFYHHRSDKLAPLITRYRPHLLVGACVLLLPPFLIGLGDSPWVYTFGLTTNYLGAAMLLCATLAMKPKTSRLSRGAAAVGRHSYSIYLWHMSAYLIAMWLVTGSFVSKPQWDVPYALHLGVFLAAAVGVGIAMSVLIEVPTLRLRDRLSPSRSGQLRAMTTTPPPEDAPSPSAAPDTAPRRIAA